VLLLLLLLLLLSLLPSSTTTLFCRLTSTKPTIWWRPKVNSRKNDVICRCCLHVISSAVVSSRSVNIARRWSLVGLRVSRWPSFHGHVALSERCRRLLRTRREPRVCPAVSARPQVGSVPANGRPISDLSCDAMGTSTCRRLWRHEV